MFWYAPVAGVESMVGEERDVPERGGMVVEGGGWWGGCEGYGGCEKRWCEGDGVALFMGK